MPLKMRLCDFDQISAALRRFKKLLERSGITAAVHTSQLFRCRPMSQILTVWSQHTDTRTLPSALKAALVT
jgi:hypothetical protein